MKPNNSCNSLRLPSSLTPSPTCATKVDKNRRKSHEENSKWSTNSVSLSLLSASPFTDTPTATTSQSKLIPSPSNSKLINKSNDALNVGGSGLTIKRNSLNDAVLRGSLTHSIKNDTLSKNNKQIQLDCLTMPPVVLSASAMPSSSSIVSERPLSTSSTGVLATEQAANNSTSLHQLTPESNISANLSSNSSLNSNSVKSSTSKSNDGTTTGKKRKALSSGRQKKFHRHFHQVAADEEVINYFSCAFVSDILLQGYLYITKNYIAFYSNVFGYVTKLLIPIMSVIKISKEKTVKIIPNAIAVATMDERHVFSSFLSRESAYQLMVSVWQDVMPQGVIDLTPSTALLRSFSLPIDSRSSSTPTGPTLPTKLCAEKETANASLSPIKHTLQVVHQRRHRNDTSGDLDISEIEDDSSSAISGNENLTQQQRLLLQSQTQLQLTDLALTGKLNNINGSSSNGQQSGRESNSEPERKQPEIKQSLYVEPFESVSSTAAVVEVSTISFYQFQIPRKVHVAYFGLLIVIILALIAGFLVYRIVETKANQTQRAFSIDDLNGNIPANIDIYAEILKWQKDMQSQRVQLTRNVLANNLEQIAKISDSLETLSNLIHTRKNSDIDEEISSIMGQCDSLEACVKDQNPIN